MQKPQLWQDVSSLMLFSCLWDGVRDGIRGVFFFFFSPNVLGFEGASCLAYHAFWRSVFGEPSRCLVVLIAYFTKSPETTVANLFLIGWESIVPFHVNRWLHKSSGRVPGVVGGSGSWARERLWGHTGDGPATIRDRGGDWLPLC